MPTSVYFELRGYDRYHRADWEDRLLSWFSATPAEFARASTPDEAGFIIEPQASHSFIAGNVFKISPDSHYLRFPEKTFAWDSGDFPTGRLPGAYCSLSQRLAHPRRHRSFCYPLRLNRLLRDRTQSEAVRLFGFSGTVTAPLRARLLTELKPAADQGLGVLRETSSLFMRVYDPAADTERARFVDELAQVKFVLCPRGNGLSSIRLFETMEAGRVPVIISDALALPECVRWAECSVRVAEADLAKIPQLLAAREADWPRLAQNARREWERCFGAATLLPTLIGQFRSIQVARRNVERSQGLFFPLRVMPAYLLSQAKAQARRLQNALRAK